MWCWRLWLILLYIHSSISWCLLSSSQPSFRSLYVDHACPCWLFVTVQMIFSTLLQNQISKLSYYFCTTFLKFQQHNQLYTKCNTLLVSSLNLNPVRSPACPSFWKETWWCGSFSICLPHRSTTGVQSSLVCYTLLFAHLGNTNLLL